ncbi:Tubulointerstitial nephritis antigen-like, partial [Varanus komodoensis]
MPGSWLLLAALLLAGGVLAARASRTRRELAPGLHERGIRDAGGSYCERHGACCHGRDDACTVPYLDTICYCDLFCNRTISDCCPDFWEYCLGIEPPFPSASAMGTSSPQVRHIGTTATSGVALSRLARAPPVVLRLTCSSLPFLLSTCRAHGQWDCENHACLINRDIIDAINRGNYGWRASNYSQMWGMTLEEGIQYRLGTVRPPTSVMNMNELQVSMDANEVLPPRFNAAEKWPGMIQEPLDQGNCAGSWAFSTAAVASDRISIHSMGHMTPALSPQNLLSCNTRHQQGCGGGRIDGAWWFLRRRG